MSDGKGGDDLRVFDDLVAGKGWSLAPDAAQPGAAASDQVEVIPDPFGSSFPKGMPPLPASMPPLPASARPAGMPPLPPSMPPLPNLSLDDDQDEDTAELHASEQHAIEAHASEDENASVQHKTVAALDLTDEPAGEGVDAGALD